MGGIISGVLRQIGSDQMYVDGVSYFQIMRHGHPNFDLKINVGQHDLISWSSDFA